MGSVLKPILTLKEYFWCHVYCAHLGAPWYQIVGASRTVSNRGSGTLDMAKLDNSFALCAILCLVSMCAAGRPAREWAIVCDLPCF